MPITRGIAAFWFKRKDATTVFSYELASDIGDRFRVEHEIVLFKQAGDARLVELHLQLTHAQGAEHRDTLSLHAIVVHLDPFHAERRDGVEIGDSTEAWAARPGIARNETDAGPAGVEHQLGALDHGGGLRAVGHLDC